MSFKFDFDLDDIVDDGSQIVPSNDDVESTDVAEEPAQDIPLDELLDALPPRISFSPLNISLSDGRSVTIARRDLFDARFQLIQNDDDNDADANSKAHREASNALAFLDAPSDLLPGVYEGGLKTWECASDLVAHLDATIGSENIHGRRILEIGCGTAVPSLYLLSRIYSESAPPQSKELTTALHLQDYNRAVLELVTVPNVLLAWYFSRAADSYRASSEDDQNADLRPDTPGELDLTPSLLAAFRASLTTHHLTITLTSGSWSSFTPAPSDLILTSETVYRRASLPVLVPLLRVVEGGTCLVAAKLVYFGIGGGVVDFVSAVEDAGGKVESVWERTQGVGRRVMRVRWE